MLQPGPITLYAQLASILRSRIISGAWASGEEIPTLEELAAEFSVARVTVRQAIQMLASENLISSHRGRRTIVTHKPSNYPILWSIGAVERDTSDFSLSILTREEIDSSQMPSRDIFVGDLAGKYMYIRKIDMESKVPYSLSSNYISSNLFRKFPDLAEERIKVTRLVRDYGGKTAVTWKEQLTVGTADYIEAGHLQCPLAEPIARVTRVCVETATNKIRYVGFFAYIGSRYKTERDITAQINE